MKEPQINTDETRISEEPGEAVLIPKQCFFRVHPWPF
jgi:hypothetical protein